VQQFYLRMIRTALDEAKAVKGVACPYVSMPWGVEVVECIAESWDSAIMARAWIARETPDRHADREGFLLSFEHACEVLGLNSDYEATWMLREIDECADFDTEEVHARVEWLNANPPDDVDEPMFEAFRVVPVLDQGSLFGEAA
jgi:hypothetical protein